MNDSARMSEVADPDAARYERLERLHLGDPDKRTGIYVQRLATGSVAIEPQADGWRDERGRGHGA
jgi:hypothetical protein